MKPEEQQQLENSLDLRTTKGLSNEGQTSTQFFDLEVAPSAIDQKGARIGNYVLVDRLGQGGFGTVWRAEQSQPVRREVAIKILKLGMDSSEIVGRFAQERQALALMEHPGIAKVLDAGITDNGRPYFVMELVRGFPLTRFCNNDGLGLQDRLGLFIQLCKAVHHAHLKGIIHRDLKPSNILVYRSDQGPVVKIIDFGIAKATEGSLSGATLQTQVGQFMGTPAYMSPEQADGLIHDLDTRADVYSLGVVLYELLTGELPFDTSKASHVGYDELRRMIREQIPQRPSQRLRSLEKALVDKITQAYRIEHKRIVSAIRGDLDWIIMKALEKDRLRRYDTAQDLALDIQRHLSNEPVVARPPSTSYLISRFVARNRFGVAAVSIIALTLIGATVLSTRMFFKEQSARQLADAETIRSRQMVRILSKMILAAGPSVAQGRDTALMKDLLASTAQEIDKDLKNQPEIELEIRELIGKAYTDVGDFDKSLAMQQRVTELQRQLYPNDHEKIADGLAELAASLDAVDRLEDAEKVLNEAIRVREKAVPRSSKSIAQDRELLAWILERRGDLVNSEIEARQALAEYSGVDTDAKVFQAQALMTLGLSLLKLAKFEESEVVHRQALEIYRGLYSKPHPNLVTAINNLCHLLCEVGKFDEVEILAQEGLKLERLLDGEPFGVCTDALNKALAQVYAHRNDYAKAIKCLEIAIQSATKVYSEDHRFTNDKRAMLIQYQVDMGVLDQATATLSEAKRLGGKCETADNSLVLAEAKLMLALGNLDEAKLLAESDYERTKAESLQPSISQIKAMHLLAQIESKLGNSVAANELVQAAIAIAKPDLNPDSVVLERLNRLRLDIAETSAP